LVCCECSVLSGRGLCDELITHPEESYRMWCVVVCDLGHGLLKNEEAMTRVGSQRNRKKKCTYIHPHWQPRHPLCSWPGYWPAKKTVRCYATSNYDPTATTYSG
jgi:hypothetical protein